MNLERGDKSVSGGARVADGLVERLESDRLVVLDQVEQEHRLVEHADVAHQVVHGSEFSARPGNASSTVSAAAARHRALFGRDDLVGATRRRAVGPTRPFRRRSRGRGSGARTGGRDRGARCAQAAVERHDVRHRPHGGRRDPGGGRARRGRGRRHAGHRHHRGDGLRVGPAGRGRRPHGRHRGDAARRAGERGRRGQPAGRGAHRGQPAGARARLPGGVQRGDPLRARRAQGAHVVARGVPVGGRRAARVDRRGRAAAARAALPADLRWSCRRTPRWCGRRW